MPTRDEVSRELAEELGFAVARNYRWARDGSWIRDYSLRGDDEVEFVPDSVRDALISLKLELIAARERIRELEKKNA